MNEEERIEHVATISTDVTYVILIVCPYNQNNWVHIVREALKYDLFLHSFRGFCASLGGGCCVDLYGYSKHDTH